MIKYRIYLFTVLILLTFAIVLYFSSSNSTIRKKFRNFAVENVSVITKISLESPTNERLTLVRNNDYWKVNDKFIARIPARDSILKAINRLNVKSPVPKEDYKSVIDNLSNNSTKIEIFKGRKIVKRYYLYQEKSNQFRTYMILDNSSQPFIIHIPGFSGRISSLFTTDEYYWRDKTIFQYKFKQILSISVEYPGSPEKSFKIFNQGENNFALKSLFTNTFIKDFDIETVIRFISNFEDIEFESFVRNIEVKKRISIFSQNPAHIISVEDINNKVNRVKTFPVPVEGLAGDFGNNPEYDLDRMFAVFNNDKDTVIVKYFVFDPVLKKIDYFLPK